MKKLLLFLIFVPFIFSCTEEDNDSIIAIDLESKMDGAYLMSGEIYEIILKSISTDGDLINSRIETFDNQRGQIVLQDSTIKTKNFSQKYYYSIPHLKNDTVGVKFTFSFTNSKGYTHSITRNIYIVRCDEALEERSGIILYCSENNGEHPNGYYLKEMRPIMTSLVDSVEIDFSFPDISNITESNIIPRQWITNTNLNFSRNNSFDYSNASSLSIEAAYNSSIHNPIISNIKDGDIIIIGRENRPIGAIQVVNFFDTGNLSDSRVLINIKAIKSAL